MKYKGFYDLEQMQSYLRRCVIRLDNEPIYITEVEKQRNRAGKVGNKIHYLSMTPDHKRRVIDVESKRVNFAPVPLGLLNYSYNGFPLCFSVARIPSRMWKIGLSVQNMSITGVGGNRRPPCSTNDIIYHEALRKTIIGSYPSYHEAIELVQKEGPYTTIAFSRHFGVQCRKTMLSLVYYKFDERVGTCELARPRLKSAFSFLQEHLDGVSYG